MTPSLSDSAASFAIILDGVGDTDGVISLDTGSNVITVVVVTRQPFLPVPIRGINSDNDSVFINETLLSYCEEHGIEFTLSRAYRKNDQAWIEQKNGSVVRRFVGHERYSGPMAGQTMAHLYGAMRLYVNHFQPSFHLLERSRDGGSVKKRYGPPATPCDRLLWRDDVSEETKPGSTEGMDESSCKRGEKALH